MKSTMQMDVTDIGFGLSTAQNDEIALVGGARSGNSDPGETRVKFDIYDITQLDAYINDGMKEEDAQKKSKSGFVELYLTNGENRFNVAALVNIEINEDKQGNGLGRKVVQSLMATSQEPLDIIDITPDAFPFWKKMGVDKWGTQRGNDNLSFVDAHRKRDTSTIHGQIPTDVNIEASLETPKQEISDSLSL